MTDDEAMEYGRIACLGRANDLRFRDRPLDAAVWSQAAVLLAGIQRQALIDAPGAPAHTVRVRRMRWLGRTCFAGMWVGMARLIVWAFVPGLPWWVAAPPESIMLLFAAGVALLLGADLIERRHA